jgi:3-oxoacyl-[acyl-carrier-protein] synthase-3
MPPPAALAAVAHELPGEPVDNAALARLLGLAPEWIEAYVGVRKRHFATDPADGRARQTLADLCVRAARAALRNAGLTPRDLGFLVLCTATPDRPMPTTAAEVAARLGLDGVPVHQLAAGACGPVQGLALARALLTDPDGPARAGLLVGGDLHSRALPLRRDIRERPAADLVSCVLYGDAAGAAVLTTDPALGRVAVLRVRHRFAGARRAPARTADQAGGALREDHKAVEEQAPALAADTARELLTEWCGPRFTGRVPARAGAPPTGDGYAVTGHAAPPAALTAPAGPPPGPGELLLLPPQFGGRGTGLALDALRGIGPLAGSTEVTCIGETGDTGSALTFGQLARAWERLDAGASALGVTVEPGTWDRSGFLLGPASRAR